uniref:RING-type domain-containing protein n=1 Tax=Pygocentrus nattereri TaxID=42514 RepID=A0AAR2LJ84_PYGNA
FRCPICTLDVVTSTFTVPLLCLHSIWPCCLVPFHSCHDVEHSCPNCQSNVVYIHKRM